MEKSLLLAQIFGPYFVIVSLGLLLNLKTCQKLLKDFTENTALLYFGGAAALLLGLFLVNIHGIWAMNWTSLVTFICWLILVKGIAIIISPQLMIKMAKAYENKAGLLRFQLFLELVLGVYLTYQGYIA